MNKQSNTSRFQEESNVLTPEEEQTSLLEEKEEFDDIDKVLALIEKRY